MIALLFVITTVLCVVLFYFGIGKSKQLVLVFVLWQLLVATIAWLNVFEENPNLFPLIILCTSILIIVILKRIDSRNINTKILLSIHILRIPVELILYQLYLQSKIPKLMTFNGWNFDILVGVSALLILVYFLVKSTEIDSKFMFAWNLVGIIFLLIIVSLAILSSPLPIQQFAFEQPNIAVLEFPYCFLPACIVPIVFMSHILSIKKLGK